MGGLFSSPCSGCHNSHPSNPLGWLLYIFHGKISGVQDIIPNRFPVHLIVVHVSLRVIFAHVVKKVLMRIDYTNPGFLKQQLWTSVAYRSYFSCLMRKTSWLFTDATSMVILCFLGKRAATTRFILASRRLSEVQSFASLVTLRSGFQLIPDSVLCWAASFGENLSPEAICSVRRRMCRYEIFIETATLQILMADRRMQMAYPDGFRFGTPRRRLGVLLRFLDFLIPLVSAQLGAFLGTVIVRRLQWDIGPSGTVYNMAHTAMFLASNIWSLLRLSLVPMFLARRFPSLAEPDAPVYPEGAEEIEIMKLYAGMSARDLENQRALLMKVVNNDGQAVLLTMGNVTRLLDPGTARLFIKSLDRYVAVQQKQLDDIRWITAQEKATEAMSRGDVQCCICLNDFEPGMTLRRLRCMHTFCEGCIETWLLKNPHCPLCKKQVRNPFSGLLLLACQVFQTFLSLAYPTGDPDFMDDIVSMAFQHLRSAVVS